MVGAPKIYQIGTFLIQVENHGADGYIARVGGKFRKGATDSEAIGNLLIEIGEEQKPKPPLKVKFGEMTLRMYHGQHDEDGALFVIKSDDGGCVFKLSGPSRMDCRFHSGEPGDDVTERYRRFNEMMPKIWNAGIKALGLEK